MDFLEQNRECHCNISVGWSELDIKSKWFVKMSEKFIRNHIIYYLPKDAVMHVSLCVNIYIYSLNEIFPSSRQCFPQEPNVVLQKA